MTAETTHYDLVIFDMDGTLIDSEILAERVLSQATQLLTKPMSPAEVTDAFRGRSLDYTLKTLTEREGAPLPPEFVTALNDNYIEAVARELKPSEGAYEVVAKVRESAAVCVASNSEPDGVAYCLKCVGLDELFDGRLFSAALVDNPKPAPDLFLYAAEQMKVAPERCLVIEDSALGLAAARAAGMDAVGYCGNDLASREHIEGLGFPVVDRFTDVLPYFQR